MLQRGDELHYCTNQLVLCDEKPLAQLACRGVDRAGAGESRRAVVGRTSTNVGIHAFAPGLDASGIEVRLDRGVLRISGERASGVAVGNPKAPVYTGEHGAASVVLHA